MRKTQSKDIDNMACISRKLKLKLKHNTDIHSILKISQVTITNDIIIE